MSSFVRVPGAKAGFMTSFNLTRGGQKSLFIILFLHSPLL